MLFMDKGAFLLGFVKTATEAGLNDDQLASLWFYSMNYPPMREKFNKMAEDNSVDSDTLDTLINLAAIKKAEQELIR